MDQVEVTLRRDSQRKDGPEQRPGRTLLAALGQPWGWAPVAVTLTQSPRG